MQLSCVVLCGGLSTRFGEDKLKARVDGHVVISRVIEAAQKVATEVSLSVANRAQGESLLEVAGADLPIVPDLPAAGLAGPPAAILTCLLALERETILFLPGDIPWVEPAALTAFARRCGTGDCDVGTLYWPNGAVETLTQLHRRERTLAMVRETANLRGSRMRASDVLRGVEMTRYVAMSEVTSNPFCFANINTKEDLEHPKPRGILGRGGGEDLQVAGEVKELFRRGLRLQREGDYKRAASALEDEGGGYEDLGLRQIAMQCLQDSAHLKRLAGVGSGELDRRISDISSALNLARWQQEPS